MEGAKQSGEEKVGISDQTPRTKRKNEATPFGSGQIREIETQQKTEVGRHDLTRDKPVRARSNREENVTMHGRTQGQRHEHIGSPAPGARVAREGGEGWVVHQECQIDTVNRR